VQELGGFGLNTDYGMNVSEIFKVSVLCKASLSQSYISGNV